jgi:hypothetical protein
MNETKSPLTSSGIWGGIIAMFAPIIGHLIHVNITDMDIQQLADLVASGIAVIGGFIAIIGRWRATKQIQLLEKP